MADFGRDYMVIGAPSDGISNLTFSPSSSNDLLASSWDCTLRLYDPAHNTARFTHYFNGALLACAFNADGSGSFSGGLDQAVTSVDFSKGAKNIVYTADKPISAISFNSEVNAAFAGSWAKTVGVIDTRQPATAAAVLSLPGKVCSIASSGFRVVVATVGREIEVFDVRNLSQAEQSRESPLKHQTRKVACSKDGNQFAVGSIEGRLAVEFLDLSPEIQAKKYAFKCHRAGDVAYPVNAIAYHPSFLSTFATGGCDGVVNIWDGSHKKRISQVGPYSTSIAALAFSQDGQYLAIAASYTFERGELTPPPEDNVFIHKVDESEVKPKPKTNA